MARGKKTGGRKKGTPNKTKAALAAIFELSGDSPLEVMLSVMRNPLLDPELRFAAAAKAAPYVHPKLASIEHSGKDGGPIETKDVSELEVARRLAFILESAARQPPKETS